jgi:hypothetical protein
MRNISPYIVGNPVGMTRSFVGRDQVLRNIEQNIQLKSNKWIVIYGPRRIGKTSILKELECRLADGCGLRHVFLDLMTIGQIRMENVLTELSIAIGDSLGIKRQTLNINCEEDFKNWLIQILRDKEVSIVLAIDEFDTIECTSSHSIKQEFYAFLLNLLKIGEGKIRIVVTLGRNFCDLSTLNELFRHSFILERVSLFDFDETETLVRLSEKHMHCEVKWSREAVEIIYSKTKGHPMLIQMICSYLFDAYCNMGYKNLDVLSGEFIDENFDKIFKMGQNELAWLWVGLTRYQPVLLAILAESNSEILTKEKWYNCCSSKYGLHLEGAEFEHSVKGLTNWDIIQFDDDEGGYQIRVPLFKEWVKMYRPVRRVLLDLNLG